MSHRFVLRGVCAIGVGALLVGSAHATAIVPGNFNGAGTTVNGFQDFFTGSSTSEFANYTEISGGAPVAAGSSGNFTLPGDGYLHINSGPGDPNKLLYNAVYDSTNQNVLAMIEVTSQGALGDGFRGGVGAESSSTNGQGINALFRSNGNNGAGNHMNLLNDAVAWGPAFDENPPNAGYSLNTFYWVRETTAGSSITGEIWPADGMTPESAALSTTWSQGGRSGLAGLVADSSGGTGTFEVNYLLIQSPGLPQIVAAPEPASLGLIGLGAVGLLARRRRA